MLTLLAVSPQEANFWGEHVWILLTAIGLLFVYAVLVTRAGLASRNDRIAEYKNHVDQRQCDSKARWEDFKAEGLKQFDDIKALIREHAELDSRDHTEFRSVLLRHEGKIAKLEGRFNGAES